MARTFWLSTHVRYQCRHSGACCTSGWPIPIETSRLSPVQRAIDERRIDVRGDWLLTSPAPQAASVGIIAHDAQGRCVFRDDGRCAIHHALGHGALPSACQHFPRIVLIDPRGIFVTLSHYCPTAAALLFDAAAAPAIVEGPSALPDGMSPEGLDARTAWAPLLTPTKLMDHKSYALWEAHMVTMLGAHAPADALARLEADVDRLQRWRASDGPLEDAVRTVTVTVGEDGRREPDAGLDAERKPGSEEWAMCAEVFELVRSSVVSPLEWPDVPEQVETHWDSLVQPGWTKLRPVVGRYLAARAFASWVAYQGTSLRAVVRSVGAALSVLEVEAVRACVRVDAPLDRARLLEAIRRSDLLLMHYVDRQLLAHALSC